MLLEKKSPHFLTSLLVRLVACAFLLIGGAILVMSMVQLALGDGLIEGVFCALILLLSGFLLLRLRSNGLWLFALLVLYAYGRMIVLQEADFWPQFFFNLILLMVLCLIFPSYFALRRGEGRETARLVYFFVALLYIALTSLSFAAYYDDAFCAICIDLKRKVYLFCLTVFSC